MLSSELLSEFRKLGKQLRTKQEAFVVLYQKALVEIGGQDWHNGDVVQTFKTITKDLKPVIVDEGYLSSSVFHAYCHAARLSLIFDVPFSIANRCSVGLLPAVKTEFDADDSEDSNSVKFAAALGVVRDRQKNLVLDQPKKRTLPFPEQGESADEFVYRVCRLLVDHSLDDRVAGMLKHPLFSEIVRHSEDIVAAHDTRQIRKAS